MTKSETSPLSGPENKSAVISCYDATPPLQKSRSSVWSAISERRLSTARFLGIMIPKDFWYVCLCAGFSLGVSTSTVFINSDLFKKYRFPVEFTQVLQMGGTVLISAIIGELVYRCRSPNDLSDPFWPRFEYKPRLALKMVLLAAVFTFRVMFTNFAIQNTQVSTYQVTRQSAIFYSVVISYFLLKYKPTCLVCCSVALILSGVFVCAGDPSTLSPTGVLYGTIAAISSASYLCVVKFYMPLVNSDHRVLVNYNSVGSMIMVAIYVIIRRQWNEARQYFPRFADPGMGHDVSQYRILALLTASVLSTFLVNIATTLFVKVSSPVTYDVVGTLKGTLQLLYGIFVNGDTTTANNLIGIGMSIVGSIIYGKAKHLEHVNKVKRDAAEKKRLSLERRNQVKGDQRQLPV